MTLSEIKLAILDGKTVKWSNDAYDVIRDSAAQYLIVCSINGYTIGLTWRDGTTMNGNESDFYII